MKLSMNHDSFDQMWMCLFATEGVGLVWKVFGLVLGMLLCCFLAQLSKMVFRMALFCVLLRFVL